MVGMGIDESDRQPAVLGLLEQHHAAAELLADAAAGAGGPADAVIGAWTTVLADAGIGPASANLRAELLRRVIDGLADDDRLDRTDTEPMPAPGPFLADEDRWARWWAGDGPAPWPEGCTPDRDVVLRALRRIPVGPRVLLVLRDAAGLDPHTVAGIIGQAPAWQAMTLQQARDAFVIYVDAEVAA